MVMVYLIQQLNHFNPDEFILDLNDSSSNIYFQYHPF
jgi:hypothetical protein